MSGPARMFKSAPRSPILKQIYRLNHISGAEGPGVAYKFDANKYKAVEVIILSKNIYGPSAGLKAFWRENLPTLKFHNDDIDFIVTRVRPNAMTKKNISEVPLKLVVHGADNSKSEIDCKGKHASNILRQLVRLTDAKKVPDADIPKMSK